MALSLFYSFFEFFSRFKSWNKVDNIIPDLPKELSADKAWVPFPSQHPRISNWEFLGYSWRRVDNLNYFYYPLKNVNEFNEISYNSNNMVWGSLPGTEIPDYEDSTSFVFSS